MKTFAEFLESKRDLAAMYGNTQQQQPDILNRMDDVKVLQVNARPDPRLGTLLFMSKVGGSKGDSYNTQILFRNVQYKPLPAGGQMTFGHHLITGPNGQKYYFELLGYRGNDVEPSCDCQHFQIRLRKTQRADQPQVCKHVVKLAKYLKDKGVLTPNAANNMLWNQTVPDYSI